MANAAITALKAYAKTGDGERDFLTLLANIKGETDRSAVIMLASFLEDALVEAIKKRLVGVGSDLRSGLFDWNGAMGSFSARIKVARAFGVIDQTTFRDLEDMREMRNACAHSQKPISFAVKELRDALVAMIERPNSYKEYLARYLEKGDYRAAITFHTSMSIAAIRDGSRDAALKRLHASIKQVKKRKADDPK